MAQKFRNKARAILASGITSADASLVVDAGKGALFPVATMGTGSTGDWFKVTLEKSTGESEIVRVRTRGSGSDLFSNILRAQEGTTALSFAAGDIVSLRLTAEDFENAVSKSLTAIQPDGGEMTGHLEVPAGASGAQAIRADEALKADSFSTEAENKAGEESDKVMSPLGLRQALNAEDSSAPVYAVRAWASITGNPATLKASGNIESVTRLGAGRLRVTFVEDPPHDDYGVFVCVNQNNAAAGSSALVDSGAYTNKSVTGFDVSTWFSADGLGDVYEASIFCVW